MKHNKLDCLNYRAEKVYRETNIMVSCDYTMVKCYRDRTPGSDTRACGQVMLSPPEVRGVCPHKYIPTLNIFPACP